jgi:hypothetical protein
VPKALRPIFKDREEFTGGHTLAAWCMAPMQTETVEGEA